MCHILPAVKSFGKYKHASNADYYSYVLAPQQAQLSKYKTETSRCVAVVNKLISQVVTAVTFCCIKLSLLNIIMSSMCLLMSHFSGYKIWGMSNTTVIQYYTPKRFRNTCSHSNDKTRLNILPGENSLVGWSTRRQLCKILLVKPAF